MKKYFLGSLAIAVAVGFSAFKFAPQTLVFTGDVTSSTSVATPSNWKLQSAPTCSGSTKACTIVVDDQYIISNELDNSAVISVAGSSNFRPTQVNLSGNRIDQAITNKN